MNIVAGGQFHSRKPRQEAANAIPAASISDGGPYARLSSAPLHVMNTPSEAAMPSIPSMKLNRFRIHTIPSRARTCPPQPRSNSRSPIDSGGNPTAAADQSEQHVGTDRMHPSQHQQSQGGGNDDRHAAAPRCRRAVRTAL